MRAFLLFLAGLFLGACTSAPPLTPSPSHTLDAAALQAKTVALVLPTDDGLRAFCSGVWVSPVAMVTAEHCVDEDEIGGPVLFVTHDDMFVLGDTAPRPDQRFELATVAVKDPAHDLALLKAVYPEQSAGHEFAHTSLSNIRPGAFVQTMGAPLGLWWSYSAGHIAAVRFEDVGIEQLWIQTTAPISPGNSGCGLFDESGHLIGIASRSATRGQAVNFFVHAVYVDALLKQAL